MNHLVGLDVGEAVPSDNAEIEALQDFTAVHEAARSASWPADAAPAYRIDPSVLGADGWRPLDSHTLLRFLRADKRHGELNPGASAARLRNALAWCASGPTACSRRRRPVSSRTDATASEDGWEGAT